MQQASEYLKSSKASALLNKTPIASNTRSGFEALSSVEQKLARYADKVSEDHLLILKTILFRGKLTRSKIFLAIEEHLSHSSQPSVDLMVAVELLHEASLIHDDVQDQQMMRRGKQTVFAIVGTKQAINIGDQLISFSFDSILSSNTMDAGEKIRTISVLNSTFEKMVRGQSLEMNSLNSAFDLSKYWEVVQLKTCSLIEAIAKLARPSDLQLKDMLVMVGELYQLDNDTNDFMKLGDSLDFKNQIQTLPIILLHGYRNSPSRARFWRDFPTLPEARIVKAETDLMIEKKSYELNNSLQINFPRSFSKELLSILEFPHIELSRARG